MPLSIAFITGGRHRRLARPTWRRARTAPIVPLYAAAAPYRTAIEVPQGQLARLGIATGTKVIDAADHALLTAGSGIERRSPRLSGGW